MSKAPFSFHCIICFEKFHLVNRPPVVLPCGHTYVCAPCSMRLKRCMECRTPLFTTTTTPPKPPAALSQRWSPSSYHHGSASARYGSPRPPSPMTYSKAASSPPEALPVPKNLVLMSLMEAAETRMEDASRDDSEEDCYESGDDDEDVLNGMQLLNSDYGTYVVREPKGLLIHPFPPPCPYAAEEEDSSSGEDGKENDVYKANSVSYSSSSDEADPNRQPTSSDQSVPEEKEGGDKGKDDASSIFRREPGQNIVQSAFRKVTVSTTTATQESNGVSTTPPPAAPPQEEDNGVAPPQEESNGPPQEESNGVRTTPPPPPPQQQQESNVISPPPGLLCGQTVQVVSFMDGIATLARGRGYVVATSTQLVKVGNATDKACKFEGRLTAIALEKQALEKKWMALSRAQEELTQGLQEALNQKDEDPFPMAPGAQVCEEEKQDGVEEQKQNAVEERVRTPSPINAAASFADEQLDNTRMATPSSTSSPPPILHTTPPSVNNTRHVAFSNDVDYPPDWIAGSANLRELIADEEAEASGFSCTGLFLQDACHDLAETLAPPSITAAGSCPSPRGNRTGSPRSSGLRTGGVDWKTGFSGHLALSSANTHADRLTHTRGQIRMMSEHKGIAHIKRMARQQVSGGSKKSSPTGSDNLSTKTW